MSAAIQNTIAIEFGDTIMSNQDFFDYSSNDLYNLSTPLLSVLLTLERLPKPDNLSVFKGLLKQQIVDLSEQGKKLNYPTAVIDKLCCLHCIVLDEFIIHSDWGASAGWENNTLLSELFNLQSGGDLFFTITDKATRQSGKMLDLLSVIYIFLKIGFKGRYRSRQSEKIGIVIKQISTMIADNITTPDVLIKDSPVNKPLLLVSGHRYFSLTLITIISIALMITVFDYWFKETYQARSQGFRQLNNNIVSSVIVDEQSVKVAQNNSPSLAKAPVGNVATQHEPIEDKPAAQVNQQETLASYRVQLSSFSVQENANRFVKSLENNRYDLFTKRIGEYSIVYSAANSLSEAEQQKQYYNDTYQFSAIVFQLDNMSTSVL